MENKDILTQPVDLPEGEGFNTVHKSVVGAVNELHSELSSAKQSASEADLKAQAVKEKMADLETKVDSIKLQAGETGPAGPQGEKGEKGDKGADGAAGAPGKSAMDIANEVRAQNGKEPFATEEEFLASLRGADGADGRNGTDAYVDPASLAENDALVKKYVAKSDMVDEKGEALYAKAADVAMKADKTYVEEALNDKAETVTVQALMTAVKNKQDKIEKGTYITPDELTEKLAAVSAEKGSKGEKGDKGDNGLSAYELAVADGFKGTQEEWLSSLKGADGVQGEQGPQGEQGLPGEKGETGAQGEAGKDGKDGVNGKSAYEVAVANGFEGTEAAWLESLKGAQGEAGPKGDPGETPNVENFVQKDDLAAYVKTVDLPAQKTLAELGGTTQSAVEEFVNGKNFLSSEAIKQMIDEAITAALKNIGDGGSNTPAEEPTPTDGKYDGNVFGIAFSRWSDKIDDEEYFHACMLKECDTYSIDVEGIKAEADKIIKDGKEIEGYPDGIEGYIIIGTEPTTYNTINGGKTGETHVGTLDNKMMGIPDRYKHRSFYCLHMTKAVKDAEPETVSVNPIE